jgi:arylsulfatase A-like enzyme
VDAQIGRVIARLKETGEYDHTLIVFTSDHGEMLGEHWLFGKEGYFDPSYHIPMIVRDPRRQADASRGRVVDAFTESVDVMPTILDWLGREVPAQCDGQSLLPFLHGDPPMTWRREVHWEFDFRDIPNQEAETALGITSDQCNLCVIRDERYKYVHFPALPPLFFDLRQDPMEFQNLAADPAHQGLVLSYAQKMLSWRMAHAERVLANTFLTPGGVIERRGPRY